MREAVGGAGHEGVEGVTVVDPLPGLGPSPGGSRAAQGRDRSGIEVVIRAVLGAGHVSDPAIPSIGARRRAEIVRPTDESPVCVRPWAAGRGWDHLHVDAGVPVSGDAQGVLDQRPEAVVEAVLHKEGGHGQRQRPAVVTERLDEVERHLPHRFGDVRAQRGGASGPERWCVIAHGRRRPFSFPRPGERADRSTVHTCG